MRRELFKITQHKNNESITFETTNNIKDIFLDLEKKLFDLSQSVISFEFGKPIITENYSFDDRDYLTEKIKTNIENMKIN